MNKKDYYIKKIDNLKDCLAYIERNKNFYDIGFYNLYRIKITKEIKALESYIETL